MPGAWALNTQIGYAAVPWACGNGFNVIPIFAGIAALLALFGAFLSWRAFRSDALRTAGDAAGGRPHHLLAGVGISAGLLFALVILTQASASFFLQGCER